MPKFNSFDWRALAMLGLAIASAFGFMLNTFLPSLRATTHGFPVYYTSARLVVDGRWSTQVYDDAWFGDRVSEYLHSSVREIFAPNPPGTALILLPLAWLDAAAARAAWLWINLGLLIAVLAVLMAAISIRGFAQRAGFMALAFAFAPLRENFRLGQVYLFLLSLFVLMFWSWRRGRSVAGGLMLGAALATKLSGIPLGLMLAVRGRWRAIAATASAIIGFIGLSLITTGPAGWAGLASVMPAYVTGVPPSGITAYQTTPSFFRHLLVAEAQWNPQPIARLPWLANGLSLSIMLGSLAITLWAGRHADWDLAFASALTLGVIIFPMAEEYHYTLLLLPLAVMLMQVAHKPFEPINLVWFGVIALLLAVPWPYKSDRLSSGWLALLAYPRLYGGWLLWLWLIKRMFGTDRRQLTSHVKVSSQ
jgi:hypothetical protein